MAIPTEIIDVAMLSFLNPGTIGVGYGLGRRADQRQKLVVVGFAAGLAGAAFAWALMATGFFEHKERLLVGIFVMSGLLGMVWGAIGLKASQMRRAVERESEAGSGE